MVNILVIDSYAVYRYGLTLMLKENPEFRVIGDAADTSDAMQRFGAHQPDIILMDIFMPGGEGVEAITIMQQKFPDVKIIVFTLSDREDDFLGAMRAGARAYLLKSIEAAELIESIHLVATGHAIVSPLMAFRLPEEFGGANKRNNQEFVYNSESFFCLRDTLSTRALASGFLSPPLHCQGCGDALLFFIPEICYTLSTLVAFYFQKIPADGPKSLKYSRKL